MSEPTSTASTVQNTIQNANETVSSGLNAAKDTIDGAKNYIRNGLGQFSSKVSTGISDTGFLNSNSIIAKFVFLILVLVVFLFLLNLGVILIQYFTAPKTNPYLSKGMLSGSSSQTIPQDPANKDSLVIYRSNNKSTGIEFTWSVWVMIDNIGKVSNKVQHIFHKGTDDNYTDTNPLVANGSVSSYTGFAGPNNGPGLYLDATKNTLYFVLDVISPTSSTVQPSQVIDVSNVPMKKWVHCAFRLQNKVLDVYINGIIVTRRTFDYIPKQNYDDVHIGKNGGFSGSVSDLRYFDNALSAFKISKIVYYGPNTSASSLTTKGGSNYDYLSSSWFNSKWYS
jgi:hypothetical protein